MGFGMSLSQQTPAEVHEQGPEPDGKWDYREDVSWDLGSLFASKLKQKFMSKDQNQMVSEIIGSMSWDLGCL
jgi:hypothetical protein